MQTNKGPMKVLRANMFRNSVALLTDTNQELELTLDAVAGAQSPASRRAAAPGREARCEAGEQALVAPVRMTS